MDMKDPRDARFFEIQKKAKTTLLNLSPVELQEYQRYVEKMIASLRSKLARKQWITLKQDIELCMSKDKLTQQGGGVVRLTRSGLAAPHR
jgi:hypothetical protein